MEHIQHTLASTKRVSKRQRYIRNACNQCKLRKVKCSGELQCQNCSKNTLSCTYACRPRLRDPGLSNPSRKLEGIVARLRTRLDEALEQFRASGLHDDFGFQTVLHDVAAQINTCTKKTQTHLQSDMARWRQPAQAATALHIVDVVDVPSQIPDGLSEPAPISSAPRSSQSSNGHNSLDPLSRLSNQRVFELIKNFRYEAESLYPFIPLNVLTSLAGILFDPSSAWPDVESERQTESWDDMFDSRNMDLLRLLLACALASETSKENELSHQLMIVASERLSDKISGASPDLKDIAVATLLSVYFLQCDDLTLAWRKIGIAAKMCLETGLHKASSTDILWAPSTFWCVYVLDRRFSFMINLPYTLHDNDVDRPLPPHDCTAPYLLPLVNYVRLGARVLRGLPSFGKPSDPVDASTCASLEYEIDQWALTTTTFLSSTLDQEPRELSNLFQMTNFHNAFVAVCKNQLKISLYKQALFCPKNIARNPRFCQKAVSYAIDTIKICSNLKNTTTLYEAYAVHYNFFVLSAVAVLYLALRHAPQQLSYASHGLLKGLKILKTCCIVGAASERLRGRVRALENAATLLGGIPSAGMKRDGNLLQLDRNQYIPRPVDSREHTGENWERDFHPNDLLAESELSPMPIWDAMPALDHSLSDQVESFFVALDPRHSEQCLLV